MRCKTDGGGAYPGMESRRGNFSGGKGREGGREGISLSLPLSLWLLLSTCAQYTRARRGRGREGERESTASSVPPN